MDLEEPSHPGDLHGSGWFRSPQQYGKHALHDYGWLLKMLTENLHKVLSKIAKRDPRLVQKDECSAKTWDIPKNIKLTPWGRPEVTAAAAAPASLRPSMAGPPEQACYGAAAKAGDTAPPGKRARPGAGAGYAVRPAAGVPVVRGGVRPTMGGMLPAVEMERGGLSAEALGEQRARTLRDALEQMACQLSISHAERGIILRCLGSVVAKLDHEEAMHVLHTYAQTYEEIPLPCVYTVMVELIAHYFATTFEAQQQLCEHLNNKTGRDRLQDCAEHIAHNKGDVVCMKSEMMQALESKLRHALRLDLNPKQSGGGKLQANTTVTFAVCACMGASAGYEQQDTDPLLWLEGLAVIGMISNGTIAEGTFFNLTERIWEVMALGWVCIVVRARSQHSHVSVDLTVACPRTDPDRGFRGRRGHRRTTGRQIKCDPDRGRQTISARRTGASAVRNRARWLHGYGDCFHARHRGTTRAL